MAFTVKEFDDNIRDSLSIARQRRAQAINGVQQPLLDPNRTQAALERRRKKNLEEFGEMPPELHNPNAPLTGPNGRNPI